MARSWRRAEGSNFFDGRTGEACVRNLDGESFAATAWLAPCEYRDSYYQDLPQWPCADCDVVAVTQSDAAANGSRCDVDLGAQTEGSVPGAAKRFRKVVAAIVAYLPQCVASETHIHYSKNLARAALNLERVAARNIN